jgi:hypothetical protein
MNSISTKCKLRNKVLHLAFTLCAVLAAASCDPEISTGTALPVVDWANEDLSHGIVTGRYYDKLASTPDKYFDEWADMGVRWIRIEFEDQAKGLASTSLDSYRIIIHHAHKRGIRVLAIVGVNSMPGTWDWNLTTKTITDETVNRYVAAADQKLAMGIDAIEISNEPWVYGFGSPSSPWKLAGYGTLLTETYKRLKPKYPDVAFMGPVTANAEPGEWYGAHGWPPANPPRWEESIFGSPAVQAYRDANGGRLPLDVISWHPYGNLNALPATSVNGQEADPREGRSYYSSNDFVSFVKWVEGFKDQKGRPIVGDYPVVFSEYSWDTKNAFGSTGAVVNQEILERQRLFFEAFARRTRDELPNVKAAFIYTWQDDEAGGENKYFGLIRNSIGGFARKPIYNSFVAWASGVGLGTDNTVVDGIIDQYLAWGGKATYGTPSGKAVQSGLTWSQSFSKGQTLSYSPSRSIR